MKRFYLCAIIILTITVPLFSSPTIGGIKGVLRVYAADPEIYSARKPTLFFGFYQGYAKENELTEQHYGFSITMLVFKRFESSYLIENVSSDFREKPLSNDFKLKLVLLSTPFLKISPMGEFGFPIGGEGGETNYGGYLLSTIDLGATRKFLPLRFHINSGYSSYGEQNSVSLSGAAVYPTKFVDFFFESGIDDLENSSAVTLTPGIKAKLWGIRISTGVDFKTEGTPENKFNFMFSWLGPFSGVKEVPDIGIGKIEGYVYDTKTNQPIESEILLEGNISRITNSNSEGKFSIVELPPGEYTAFVSADEYIDNIKETEVLRGETKKLRIGLEPIEKFGILAGEVRDKETKEPLMAALKILPIDINISSDSTSGTFDKELEEGGYKVTVEKNGYYPIVDTFLIQSDSTTERIYELVKIERMGIFSGKILDDKTDNPLQAVLKIEDRSLMSDSISGEFSCKLEEGNYKVHITKEEYRPIQDTIPIKSDSVTIREYRMTRIEKKIIAFRNILFDFDKYFIRKEYYSELDSIANYLENSKQKKLKLVGHTCSLGSDEYNLELSKKRALSVKESLIERGISDKILSVEYFGESKPTADNSTEEGREKNRRVEIIQK
jgi:outer membrane protein OmpA-like peptidoglycan-associated protein